MRRALGTVVVIIGALLAHGSALSMPADEGSGGWDWYWGHNFVSPNNNGFSGYNYTGGTGWVLQYIHKHSTRYGAVYHGWQRPDLTLCGNFATAIGGTEANPLEVYIAPWQLNCGGYVRNYVVHAWGDSSYLFEGAS